MARRRVGPARVRLRLDLRDDRGFTLIELLVVVIIIGILSGIAIPVYLNQRRKAYRAAAIADMKNAVLAVETYASGNNGSYLGLNNADQNALALNAEGYNKSPWSDFLVYSSSSAFCIKGRHKDLAGLEIVFRTDLGFVEVGTPGAFPCDPYT